MSARWDSVAMRPAGQHATTDAADSERTAVDPVIDLVSGVRMALSEVRGRGPTGYSRSGCSWCRSFLDVPDRLPWTSPTTRCKDFGENGACGHGGPRSAPGPPLGRTATLAVDIQRRG